MKFVELLQLIQDETKAEEYLRSNGILKTFTNCPRCNGTDPRLARGDRWKCYKCKTEWTRRKDSLLSLVRISYSEFLLCAKFFELENTVERTSSQLLLNYKTVNLLFNEFRKCISGYSEIQINKIKGKTKGNSEPFFINIENDRIEFQLHEEGNEANSKFEYNRTRIPNSSASYDLSYNRLRNFIRVGKGVGYFSNLDRFWRFAKESLLKFRGTEDKSFLLYLKEIEFRYNNSGSDLFDLIIAKIAQNQRVVR